MGKCLSKYSTASRIERRINVMEKTESFQGNISIEVDQMKAE